ncbi:bifunctional methylenetetrahydrofolate dehydrogenase/cyclohydrolase, mitochondrial isoform X2 [Bacillus rossius redtenbacheri]|uniref:bifunctional methylenetetrahydrofolate dehydrogenase/cyclohydrolase, mitochondrial isoform X2 n=1 Tax=Bacillus rossius redtenbacheri TaxID=93214 RepID=UPI002FDEA2EE
MLPCSNCKHVSAKGTFPDRMKYAVIIPLHKKDAVVEHVSARSQSAEVIDGRGIAAAVREELRREVARWVSGGRRRPQLTAVCVGEDPASAVYVRNKMVAAKEVGIESRTLRLPKEVTEEVLLDTIGRLNADADVDGILVQTPLPEHVSERAVCDAVAPGKDVDCFNAANVARFCLGTGVLVPCTALAVREILRRAGIETRGKHAVVCGRSKHVGWPIAMLLHAGGTGKNGWMDATTTICHRHTPPDQLALITRSADIIVSAAGVPNLIKSSMVKRGACVIDVGITRITDSAGKKRLVGDVDFKEVSEVAGHITRVPGGVGPVTVSMLMRNTVVAAKQMAEWDESKPQGRNVM